MSCNLKLGLYTNPEPNINVHEYQSRIGSVMYAMLGTCPDIAFSITKLSQYSANPGDDHWTAINRLLRYLSSTRDLKLTYDGNSKCDDESRYSDSDWAGDPKTIAPFPDTSLLWLEQL